MSQSRRSVSIDSALYERAAAAAAEDAVATEELVERALRRLLALRALGRLQAASPWQDLSEGEVMDIVVAEQKAARAQRRAHAS
ncbi:MAG TPA: hypothetical protein VM324_15165 [Egibacteraceae bacterium]|nr:hypothetical protein [Egibacteraceae bacterium]